jgi:hypothetical protein
MSQRANEKNLLPNHGEMVKVLILASDQSGIHTLPFGLEEEPVMDSGFYPGAIRKSFSRHSLLDASPIREFGVSNSEPET